MGYETEVPPVPDRLTEEEMIGKIKESFKDQSYLNLEIPEAMRTRKLEWRKNLKEYRFAWIGNFLRGGLAFSMILFPFGLLFKKTGLGVPTFTVPRMYARAGANDQFIYRARNYRASKVILPIWLFASYTYATMRTSNEVVFDENYTKISSVILPYEQ